MYSFKFPAAVFWYGILKRVKLDLAANSYNSVCIISSGRMSTPVHWYQCSVGTSSVSNAGYRLWLVISSRRVPK